MPPPAVPRSQTHTCSSTTTQTLTCLFTYRPSAFLKFTSSLFFTALQLVAAASNHFLSFSLSFPVCLSVSLVTSQPGALPSLKPPAWPGPMPSPGRMQPAVLIGCGAEGCPHIRAKRGGAAKGGEVEEITKFVTIVESLWPLDHCLSVW